MWTRLSGETGRVAVRYEVSLDEAFTTVVRRGVVHTDAARDHTVKIDCTGLTPATTYFFRFACGAATSPAGRTRTAPVTASSARFALASCGSYAAGWFNPYARIAAREVDLVVHVGDYIYEGGYSAVRGTPQRGHECVSLDDYRARYAQYRADPDLQHAHQRHPWVLVWDDHEIANDAWTGGADAHDPARDGDWAERKAAAVRAWHEWMPVRAPEATDPFRIWRSFRWGNLVDLLMLDTRLYGRSHPELVPAGRQLFQLTEADDPARTMLGERQREWLLGSIEGSTAAWRVLGQQTMISPHRNFPDQVPLPYLPEEIRTKMGLRQGGGVEGVDNWNAYRVERDLLIAALRRKANNVVLTGDIHTAWACDVTEDPYTPYHAGAVPTGAPGYERATGLGSGAVEFVCTSVTSHNAAEGGLYGVPPELIGPFNAAVVGANPNVSHFDAAGHGFTLVDIDEQRVQADFVETGTALSENRSADTVAASWMSRRGEAGQPLTDHLVPTLSPL